MARIDFGFYLALFLKRLPWFLLVVVGVASIGLAFTYSMPRQYRAAARILAESPQIPTDLARSTVPTGAMEQFQIIEQDVMSRSSLVDLAKRFDLYKDKPDMSPIDIVDDMRSRIGVEPVSLDAGGGQGAISFNVSFTAQQAKVAADVTNELVRMILARDVELRTGRADDTLKFFTLEVNRLSAALKQIDDEILAFENAHIDALPDSLDFRRSQEINAQQRLLALSQEETRLRSQREDLLATGRVAGEPATPAQKMLSDLEDALAAQATIFRPDSPAITMLKARIEALKAQIKASPDAGKPGDDAEPVGSFAAQLADIDDRLKLIRAERDQINAHYAALAKSIAETPANETALNALQRSQKNLQAQYDSAVARLADATTGAQIEAKYKGARLSLIESALPPPKAYKPNRLLMVAATAVAALALGFATVALPEFFNRRVRRPAELVGKLGIQPLVAIPYITTSRERTRRRLTSLAVTVLVIIAIPGLLLVVNFYVMPLDGLVNQALTGAGTSLAPPRSGG